jgi:cytochrome c-type biogenesis protein
MEILTPQIVFLAGIISIASPCVLPLIPAIVAHATQKGKFRPLAIVLGISITFVVMGTLAGVFGEAFSQYQYYINIFGIGVIIFMGIWMLFNLHLPLILHTGLFNKIGYHTYSIPSEGVAAGLLLGLALGIVWVPCVGPILGTILTLVAANADPYLGAKFLAIYSAGFAIPMLAIAYSSRISTKILSNSSKMIWIKRISGVVLIIVGVYLALQYI